MRSTHELITILTHELMNSWTCVFLKINIHYSAHQLRKKYLLVSQAAYVGKYGVRGKLMLIVGDTIFLDQFWMRTSKKYVSNLLIIFSRSNGQCQRSKSLKCLVWTCNKLHLVGNAIFRVTYTQQINVIHKHLVFYTVKFKSEVDKYILK